MKVNVIEAISETALKRKKVCAYARVSTDSGRQEDSLENQKDTYERLISANPEYEFAGVYADQGVSGYCENRPSFQSMMEQARRGEIDLIITKTISRFARNTVTVLKAARELKELGVSIFFEEQNINTLSGDGEMMLAVLASFAQEESRSMSENNKWSIQKKFERGEMMINTSRFMGYDKDEYGDLIINRKEAEVVKLIFDLYLMGIGTFRMAALLTELGVKTVSGMEWEGGTIGTMLQNEKYKGDAILQKSYTMDFLSKKRAMNKGEIQKYCVEENHDAIIATEMWECVQLEMEWRRQYCREHGTNSFSHNTENNPFASKIICGNCNRVFARKGWQAGNGLRRVWQCGERYKVKGVAGCNNRHVDEETLKKAYLMAWNAVLENREQCIAKWKQLMEGEDLRAKYHAGRFVELTEGATVTEEFDVGLMLATLECIRVCEDGMLVVRFYDGMEIECRNEEE